VIARWNTIDPRAEIYQHWTPYNYVADSPIRNTDPDGTSVNGSNYISTRYVDPNGNEILNTDDGRNDVYVVPWDRRSDFEGNIALWQGRNSGVLNSQQWNNYWRGEFTQILSAYQWNHYAFGYNSLSLQLQGEWIKQFITNDPADREKFQWDYIKSQWSDPVVVVGSFLAFAHAGVGAVEPSPTMGGRLGNAATREQVNNIANELENRGYTITGGGGRLPEEYLKPIGGGRKGGSFPDITAVRDNTTVRINTVDTYKSGAPTLRELNNASRIRAQTPGDHLLLIPKSK
jgi:hypothetical protein